MLLLFYVDFRRKNPFLTLSQLVTITLGGVKTSTVVTCIITQSLNIQ